MVSPVTSPVPISCSNCHMFSFSSASFYEGDICNHCRLLDRLETRLSDLEARLQVVESKRSTTKLLTSVSQPPLIIPDNTNVAPASSSPTSPKQRGTQGQWVTVRGKNSLRPRPADTHSPVPVANRYTPLADTPVVSRPLVIGDSVLRNVKLANSTAAICIPGARVGDVESSLKLLANDKRNYIRIVIHVGGNDLRSRRSEVTKISFDSLCNTAKSLSKSVFISSPLPNLTNDEMFSRSLSLNRWLLRWCPANDVGFIDDWRTFRGRPGLIKKDCFHPTLEGAAQLALNLAKCTGPA